MASKRWTGLWILLALGAGAVLWALFRRPAAPRHTRSEPDAAPAQAAPRSMPAGSSPRGSVPTTRPSASQAGAPRVQVRWGSAPGELGRKQDPEGNPEAPMSFVAGAGGETWVLDQVNARVQRFGPDGRLTGAVRLDGDTAQELAVGPDGKLYVLDRLARGDVAIYEPDGSPAGRVPIVGEGGAVTGMFVDANGVWLEREHTDLVRVAGPDGKPDPTHATAPGRPSRDGTTTLRAALVARGGRDVNVFAGDRWRRTLTLPHGILYLLLLDSDLRGHVYLGAAIGDEAREPPFTVRDQSTLVVRLDLATGADAGALTLPAYTGADEMFRELSVTDDGAVVQMLPSADGVTLATYRFP